MSSGLQIVSQEIIKPSSPTPPHLSTYKLSWLDQLTPIYHFPLILFYPTAGQSPATAERMDLLKRSLSHTLTLFYPLAGRQNGNSLVDCNDNGVDFIEARVDITLSHLLHQPDLDLVNSFLPCTNSCSGSDTGTLLSIQVTVFDCGGIAVGVCLSHKIGDGRSMFTFLKAWSSAAAAAAANFGGGTGGDDVKVPAFDAAAVLPPHEMAVPVKQEEDPNAKAPVKKRFVLDGTKMAALKSPTVTRVQAANAVLWRCLMRSRARVDKRNGGGRATRWSIAVQAVDLWARMALPSPENSFGNRCILSAAAAPVPENEENYESLKGTLEEELTMSIKEVDEDYVRRLQGPEGFSLSYEKVVEAVKRCGGNCFDIYFFSSWLRLPAYEVDFGWGRPVWMGFQKKDAKNTILLTPRMADDGVEAWVTLEEEEMEEFERDEELLSFLSHPGFGETDPTSESGEGKIGGA